MGQRDQQIIKHRSRLHLRVRRLGGQVLRVLTPRPGTDLLLSNNRYHDTWHLLTDISGARQLGHLAWFLAHQRRPDTVVLLDAPFVVSTPFDGDRARPVLLVPWELTALGNDALEALWARRDRLGPSDTSVRIDTRGLPAYCSREEPTPRHVYRQARETMKLRGAFIEYRADRDALMRLTDTAMRAWAFPDWPTYNILADWDGELQVFADFRARVGAAARAREQSGLQPGFAPPDAQPELWWATDRAIAREQSLRKRRAAMRRAQEHLRAARPRGSA